LNWTEAEYEEQQRRLAHARQHASMTIETDDLTPDEILARVLDFLKETT
jgi:hypothetical protein